MYSVTLVTVCCLLTIGSCKSKTEKADTDAPAGSTICDINPCDNNGTCTEIKGSDGIPFKCACPDGFTGFTCKLRIEEERNDELDELEKKAQQHTQPEFVEDKDDKIPNEDPKPEAEKAEEAAIEESAYGYGGYGSSKRHDFFYKYVHPCKCLDQCCIGTTVHLDLTRYKRGTINGIQEFVEMWDYPERQDWSPFLKYWWLDCFYPALLRISVDKITSHPLSDYYGLCQNSPGCRRMIRIDLNLANPYHWSSGHRRMFNFGDSEYNYGERGDHPDKQNWDANLEGRRYKLRFHGHEHCKRYRPWVLDDALNYKVRKLTVWIAHNFIRVKNYVGFDERFCTSCGFKLNGEYDYKYGVLSGRYDSLQDNRNQYIYLAFNRVITYRVGLKDYNLLYGYGVCSATVRYECGWKYDCCDQ